MILCFSLRHTPVMLLLSVFVWCEHELTRRHELCVNIWKCVWIVMKYWWRMNLVLFCYVFVETCFVQLMFFFSCFQVDVLWCEEAYFSVTLLNPSQGASTYSSVQDRGTLCLSRLVLNIKRQFTPKFELFIHQDCFGVRSWVLETTASILLDWAAAVASLGSLSSTSWCTPLKRKHVRPWPCLQTRSMDHLVHVMFCQNCLSF